MQIDVLNVKTVKQSELLKYDLVLYVGRGKAPSYAHNCTLGNPFTVQQYGKGNALNQFNLWLGSSASEFYRNKVEKIKARIIELETVNNKEYKIALMCWCYPNPCHANTIKELLLA